MGGVGPDPIATRQNQWLAPILSAIHRYTAITLALLIGAHLLGACYHGMIRRDGVVRRML